MQISESGRSFWLVAAALCLGRVVIADTPVWDNMTGQPASTWQIPNNTGIPVGSGSRQIGVPATLADPASLELTGFDACWANGTGAPVTLDTTRRLRLNYWVWNTVTFAATGTPAFSNAAGSGQIIFAPGEPITVANTAFVQFQAVAPPANSLGAAGTLPGIAITPHITVATIGPIGFAFNWEFDNGTGAFAQVSGSTSMIVGGASAIPAALGANAFAPPNFGYYRSPNWGAADNNGNFDAASGRQIGANSSLAIRVYAANTMVNVCCNDANGACVATSANSCSPGSTFHPGVPCSPNPCTPAMYLVSVSMSESGRGRVISTPAAIDCPGMCSSVFPHGAILELTAIPHARSVFIGWTGACIGAGSCAATLTGPMAVNAEFRCKADFNGVGALDIADVFDFLSAWFAQDPRADFDQDGELVVFDIFSFLHAWFAGC